MPTRSLPAKLPLLLALAAFLHLPQASAQTWREVQSPHFRVITDGSEGDARNVAKEFEQMRAVFANRFPNATLETGAPLLIVATREAGLRAISPVLYKQHDRVAGEFFNHWERRFALVRLDSFGDLNQAVVFHEYTHSILHANLHWLPTWLDEGLAEFYAYTRFQAGHVYVGAPSIRLPHLQTAFLLPVPELLSATGSTYAKDQDRSDLFYGESWAMVHFMSFGPNMGNGARLNDFIRLLESGTPQNQAFQQVFGDPKAFQQQLSNYISGVGVKALVFPPAEQIDTRSFKARVLTTAQQYYEVGSFDIGVYDTTEGSKLLEAAEAADPSLAGPHEEIGFLLWRQGKDAQARAEWQKAVAADPESYRSAFALLMSGTPLRQQTPQQLVDTQNALEAISLKAPKFAPAVAELALVEWRRGQLNPAYKAAIAAEKLEPWRAGYHVLTGNILAQGHQPKVAAEYARMVAARWPGPDHDEAVDLLNSLPAADRDNGPPLVLDTPQNATVVRGTILSSSCDTAGLHLSLLPDVNNAAPLTLITKGPYESGFSDTLWVGEDHYTNCHHIDGLPALVAYQPVDTTTNRILDLEVRDDLPSPPPATPKP